MKIRGLGRRPSEPSQKPKKWRKRLIILIILAIIFYIIAHILNLPSTGKISNGSSNLSSKLAVIAQSGQFEGKYISFSYPADYRRVKSALSGSYLEAVNFVGPKGSSSLISVGLVREVLDNDPTYHYRLSHSKLYKQLPAANGQKIFTSQANGFERIIYISHAGMVLTVSATDPNGNDLTTAHNQIIDSLHWR